jgi:hypothetical protein
MTEVPFTLLRDECGDFSAFNSQLASQSYGGCQRIGVRQA